MEQDETQALQLSTDLAKTKEFCINSISKSLETDSNHLGTDAYSEIGPTIIQQLDSLSSGAAVTIYMDPKDQVQDQNGYIVPTNAMIHNATGSSTKALLLGNSQQNCGSLFYIVPYLCKNKVALESCHLALEKAQQHVEKYQSQTVDTGTSKRFVQHIFTCVVNEHSKNIEISDT